MNIRKIVISGQRNDIEICASPDGAFAMEGDKCIFSTRREEDRCARWEKVKVLAASVYGLDRHGRPAATNSMLHSLMTEVERVAGC